MKRVIILNLVVFLIISVALFIQFGVGKSLAGTGYIYKYVPSSCTKDNYISSKYYANYGYGEFHIYIKRLVKTGDKKITCKNGHAYIGKNRVRNFIQTYCVDWHRAMVSHSERNYIKYNRIKIENSNDYSDSDARKIRGMFLASVPMRKTYEVKRNFEKWCKKNQYYSCSSGWKKDGKKCKKRKYKCKEMNDDGETCKKCPTGYKKNKSKKTCYKKFTKNAKYNRRGCRRYSTIKSEVDRGTIIAATQVALYKYSNNKKLRITHATQKEKNAISSLYNYLITRPSVKASTKVYKPTAKIISKEQSGDKWIIKYQIGGKRLSEFKVSGLKYKIRNAKNTGWKKWSKKNIKGTLNTNLVYTIKAPYRHIKVQFIITAKQTGVSSAGPYVYINKYNKQKLVGLSRSKPIPREKTIEKNFKPPKIKLRCVDDKRLECRSEKGTNIKYVGPSNEVIDKVGGKTTLAKIVAANKSVYSESSIVNCKERLGCKGSKTCCTLDIKLNSGKFYDYVIFPSDDQKKDSTIGFPVDTFPTITISKTCRTKDKTKCNGTRPTEKEINTIKNLLKIQIKLAGKKNLTKDLELKKGITLESECNTYTKRYKLVFNSEAKAEINEHNGKKYYEISMGANTIDNKEKARGDLRIIAHYNNTRISEDKYQKCIYSADGKCDCKEPGNHECVSDEVAEFCNCYPESEITDGECGCINAESKPAECCECAFDPSEIYYRTVDLKDMFPNERKPLYVWEKAIGKIIQQEDGKYTPKDKEVDLEYTVRLNATNMKNIREYNKKKKTYLNDSVDKETERSEFLDILKKEYGATGDNMASAFDRK